MHKRPGRTPLLAALGAMAMLVSACGQSATGPSGNAAPGTTPAAKRNAAPKPGEGRPTFILGDARHPEQHILGSLYQEALQARGYRVVLKSSVKRIYRALSSGQIQGYPEYTGALDITVAGNTTNFHSARDAYRAGQAFLRRHGAQFLAMSPFSDSGALGTTTRYASTHHLRTIAGLAAMGRSVTIGGRPRFRSRVRALRGLRRAYHVDPTFVPVTSGYRALNSGRVDTAHVFSTDPQLKDSRYVLLRDPRHVFGFDNEAMVVKQSVLPAEGPAFVQTIDQVTRLLTTRAMIVLNGAVDLDGQSPAAVAHQFLVANHLL